MNGRLEGTWQPVSYNVADIGVGLEGNLYSVLRCVSDASIVQTRKYISTGSSLEHVDVP